MATSVTQSLFGMTPEALQSQRDAALNEQALQFSKLSPMQQAQMGLFRGASQLGTGLAGLMGYQDPEMQRIKARQGLLGGIDMSDPAALRQAAKGADPEFAQQLITRAMEIEKAQAEAINQRAQAAAKLREATTTEQRNAEATADAAGFIRGTPQWQKAYQEKLDELTTKPEARIAFGADREAVALEMFQKPFSKLTGTEAAAVNKRVFQESVTGKAAGAPKTVVDLGGAMREVYAKKDAEGKNEAWKLAGEAYNMQVPMVGKLDQLRAALPRTITGAGAETFLNIGKAFSAMGVPVDPTKLANTEYFDAVSSQLVQTIAKNFPGSQAIKELEQLIKSKPNLKLEPQTITKLLDDLDLELRSNIIAYEQMDKMPQAQRYDANPNTVRSGVYRDLSRYRELERKAREATKAKPMSKAEIEEAKRLQQKLGV
jgi:hypothetical protein